MVGYTIVETVEIEKSKLVHKDLNRFRRIKTSFKSFLSDPVSPFHVTPQSETFSWKGEKIVLATFLPANHRQRILPILEKLGKLARLGTNKFGKFWEPSNMVSYYVLLIWFVFVTLKCGKRAHFETIKDG